MINNPGGYVNTLITIFDILGYNISNLFKHSTTNVIMDENIFKNKLNNMNIFYKNIMKKYKNK